MPNKFPNDDPSEFPTTSPDSYWLHSVAPFWSNGDLREAGIVRWKIYQRSDMDFSPVDTVVGEYLNGSYNGSWMLVVHWDGIHPYPHGDDQSSFYNQKVVHHQKFLTVLDYYFPLLLDKFFPSNSYNGWKLLLCCFHIQVFFNGVGHTANYWDQCWWKNIQQPPTHGRELCIQNRMCSHRATQ